MSQHAAGSGNYSSLPQLLLPCHLLGDLTTSLSLFQKAAALNLQSLAAVKQVARGLLLLGKHHAAAEVYDEALHDAHDDWELWQGRGLAAVAGKDEQRCAPGAVVCDVIAGPQFW
jgi:tetratricopeptide (TPR) repeat protein